MDNTTLEVVDGIKDLGVYYDSLLLFDKHISEKVNKAYMMLGIIKRNFKLANKGQVPTKPRLDALTVGK